MKKTEKSDQVRSRNQNTMSTYKSLETQLFSWTGWDSAGDASFYYYGCALKRDIGPFKSGDKVGTIYFSMDDSQLSIWKKEQSDPYGEWPTTDADYTGHLLVSVA